MAMKRGWHWPWLLTAGMSGIVGVNVVMLFVARSDANGVVVEQDYYRKAVQWDSTMALRDESARLGWRAEVSLASGVLVVLTDSAGAGVAGAAVQATLIHNVDAGRPTELVLREVGGGRYAADAALAHRGLWEVRIRADRGTERFAAVTRAERVDGAPPALE